MPLSNDTSGNSKLHGAKLPHLPQNKISKQKRNRSAKNQASNGNKTARRAQLSDKIQREIAVTHLKLAKPELVGSLLPYTPRKNSQIIKFSTRIERYLISSPNSCHKQQQQQNSSEHESLTNSFFCDQSGIQVLNSILDNSQSTDAEPSQLLSPWEPHRNSVDSEQELGKNHGSTHSLLQAKLIPPDLRSIFASTRTLHTSAKSQILTAVPESPETFDYAGRIPDPILTQEDLSEHVTGVSSSMHLPLPQPGETDSYSSSTIARQDIVVLESWMSKMLRKVQEEVSDMEQRYEDIQRVYYIVFYELMRQVMVQNYERGQLLHHVWVGNMMVFENRIQFVQSKTHKLQVMSDTLQQRFIELSIVQKNQNLSREGTDKQHSDYNNENPARKHSPDQVANSGPAKQNGRNDSTTSRASTPASQDQEPETLPTTSTRKTGRKNSIFDDSKIEQIRQSITTNDNKGFNGEDQWFRPPSPSPDEYESPRPDQSHLVKILSEDLNDAHDRIDSLELEMDELRERLPKTKTIDFAEAGSQTQYSIDDVIEREVKKRVNAAMQQISNSGSSDDHVDPDVRRRWRKHNSKISNVKMLFDASVPTNSEKWAVRQINKILSERISPLFESVMQPLEQFVFDFYIRKYGLPSVAKQNIAQLAKNAFQYQTNPLVSIFLKVSRSQISEESFNMLLSALTLCVRSGNVSQIPLAFFAESEDEQSDSTDRKVSIANVAASFKKSKRSPSRITLSAVATQLSAPNKVRKAFEMSTENNIVFPEDDEGNQNWVAMQRCEEILQRLFPRMSEQVREGIIEKLRRYEKVGVLDEWSHVKGNRVNLFAKTPRVDRDVFLGIFMHAVLDQEHRQIKFFEKAFREGDDNGDGVLELSEFQAILKVINPDIALAEVSRMFSDAISHPSNSGGSEDAMTPQAFSVTCRNHDLHKFLAEQSNGEFILARLQNEAEALEEQPTIPEN